jgi:signal transduction histidine kinase
LRLALEELAFTRNALAGADEKILMLERGGAPQQVPSDEAQTIASLAQELRQPLSSIISYADLLLSESVGILGALQRRFLERIKTSGERLRVIVEDLVQVAVTASSTLDLPPEPLDFSALVDEAIASVSQQVQEKELDLRLDVDEPFPAFQADRDALGQIILHLLQNACYATPRAGQVSLYARLESTGDQSGYLLIQVSDQGGGIPSQDIPHLFTRLYRSDNPLIPGVGDRGVGLSVVKTLVEAYQGRIWVDTDMGYGSTFSVLLPVMVIAGVPTSSKDQPA